MSTSDETVADEQTRTDNLPAVVDHPGREVVAIGRGMVEIHGAEPSPLIHTLRDMAGRLYEQVDVLEDAGDWASLAIGAANLDAVVADFRHLRDRTAKAAAKTMKAAGHRRVVIQRTGIVELSGGVQRTKWQHREIANRLFRNAARATEGDLSPVVVKQMLMECAGISYWKVEACERWGVDVDEFCEKTSGLTVSVKREREG